MKSLLKTGILVLTLVVPVLVYLFLKSFGENHFSLPVYFPLETIEKKVNNHTVIDTIYHHLPDFKLINQGKDTVTLTSFDDKIMVADFFFTRCPGICPVITSNLLKVQESFIDNPQVKIVSFSVDADYDRPGVLTKYAEKFGIKPQKWQLLTGDRMDIYNLGFYGFKLPADTVDKTLHSEKIALVDKEKRIRGFYTGTNKKEIDRLITEIQILLYEYEHSND